MEWRTIQKLRLIQRFIDSVNIVVILLLLHAISNTKISDIILLMGLILLSVATTVFEKNVQRIKIRLFPIFKPLYDYEQDKMNSFEGRKTKRKNRIGFALLILVGGALIIFFPSPPKLLSIDFGTIVAILIGANIGMSLRNHEIDKL